MLPHHPNSLFLLFILPLFLMHFLYCRSLTSTTSLTLVSVKISSVETWDPLCLNYSNSTGTYSVRTLCNLGCTDRLSLQVDFQRLFDFSPVFLSLFLPLCISLSLTHQRPFSHTYSLSLSLTLSLSRLTINHDLERLATVGRNSQLYLGRERASAGGTAGKGVKRGDQPQVLFLRSISLSPEAASPMGSERMLVQAMDELERASLDPRVSDTASSRFVRHNKYWIWDEKR